MDRTALHLELRNALGLADELARHTHARGDDLVTGHVQGLATLLGELERHVGQSHEGVLVPRLDSARELDHKMAALVALRPRVPGELRRRLRVLLASSRRIARGVSWPGKDVPAKSLFSLPLARVVPQAVHSLVDVGAGVGYLASAGAARTTRAQVVGLALGAVTIASAATSDVKHAPLHLLAVETHEGLDLVTGIAAAVMPFLLGYARRDPLAATIHVACGLATIASSLLTDYRADRGITRPRRSHGGPEAGAAQPVVADTTGRPLEGLSSAPTAWDA